MKKYFVIAFLLICAPAFADNTARIKELKIDFDNTNQRRSQFMEEAKKSELHLVEINGAVQELVRQDESLKKKESKTIEQPQKAV